MDSPSLQTAGSTPLPQLPSQLGDQQEAAGRQKSPQEQAMALVLDPSGGSGLTVAEPVHHSAPLLAAAQMQFVAESLGLPDGREIADKCADFTKRLEPLTGRAFPEGGFPAQIQNAAGAAGQILLGAGKPAQCTAWGQLTALTVGRSIREGGHGSGLSEAWQEMAGKAGLSADSATAVADMMEGLGAIGDWARTHAVDQAGVSALPPAAQLQIIGRQFTALGSTLGGSSGSPAAASDCRQAGAALGLLGELATSPLGSALPVSSEGACAMLLAEDNQDAVNQELAVFQQLINLQWKLIEENFERLCLTKPQFATPTEAWGSLQSLAANLEAVLLVAQVIISPTGQAEAEVAVDTPPDTNNAAPKQSSDESLAQLRAQLANLQGQLEEFLKSSQGMDGNSKFPKPEDLQNYLKSLLAWVKDAEGTVKGHLDKALHEIGKVAEKAWQDVQNILHPPPNVGPPSPEPKVNTIGMALEQLASLTSSLTSSLNSRGWQEEFIVALEMHATQAKAVRDLVEMAREHGPLVAGGEYARRVQENVAEAVARTASPEVLRTATAQLESLQSNVQALSLAVQSVPAATAAAAEALSTDPVAMRFNRLVSDVVAAGGVPSASNSGRASNDIAASARLLDEGLFHLRKVVASAESERTRESDSVRRYATV